MTVGRCVTEGRCFIVHVNDPEKLLQLTSRCRTEVGDELSLWEFPGFAAAELLLGVRCSGVSNERLSFLTPLVLSFRPLGNTRAACGSDTKIK